MSYPSFPDIQKPSYAYEETPENPGIISNMENGSQISRARFTKSRLKFVLKWNAMSATDKATLLNFYRNTVKGCSLILTWVHSDPTSEFYGQSFDVRITEVPAFQKVSNSRWSASITLLEA